MPATGQVHRTSALKQQNKQHNKLGHKSKGQVLAKCQGRLSTQSISRKNKHELSKLERRNQVKVVRSSKREKTMNKKRMLGTDTQPPFLVCVVMLCPTLNPRLVLSALTQADSLATVTTSKQGTTHVSCARYKQRYTFVTPPIDDMYAILDTIKVSNSVLLVWPCCERDEAVLTSDHQRLLSSIMAQGLPTTIHTTFGYQEMPSKRQTNCVQNLLIEIKHFFPDCDKPRLYHLDKSGEALLCLRQIGAQKQRSIFYRDHRPHMLADELAFIDDVDSGSSGTLCVSGYMRGVAMSANGLVHVPGWGDYQLGQVVLHASDPHPLLTASGKRLANAEQDEVLTPDPTKQDTLAASNEPSASSDESSGDDSGNDNGDDSDGDDCDGDDVASLDSKSIKSFTTVPVKKDLIPGAYSSYQAAWMMDNDAYKQDETDSSEDDEFEAPEAKEEADSDSEDDDRLSMVSGSDMSVADDTYDEKVDYQMEMDEYERIQACREDLEFPDEIDTPRDVLTRERFHKYRGLESFRSSPWDLSENLPLEYKRIFHIPRFNQFRRRIMKLESDPEESMAEIGQYVTLRIKDVQKHLYIDHVKTGSPLAVFGLLPYEQKMSLLNVVIKSHPVGHTRPIKSKDRLIFHVGFRRFSNQPVYSEHTAGDKQKFCRFFHPGMTVVASMYAPVLYPPASVLVFRPLSNGRQELVATGSVYSANPNRCVLKRIILSGHPFKIHKRSVVVRYMFFDRDDINWFKPIELRTKYGRKGRIKECLGTRGHMKCQFNGTLKSQDTILLQLYKRVYPKWAYDPFVMRCAAMYAADDFDIDEDLSQEEEIECQQQRDKALMPPPTKRPKQVHFS